MTKNTSDTDCNTDDAFSLRCISIGYVLSFLDPTTGEAVQLTPGDDYNSSIYQEGKKMVLIITMQPKFRGMVMKLEDKMGQLMTGRSGPMLFVNVLRK